LPNDLFRYAAQPSMRFASAAVGAHHDRVGVEFLGGPEHCHAA
jgi:hypothetical protein